MRWTGSSDDSSIADAVLDHCEGEGPELEGKTLDFFAVHLFSNPPLWS